MSSVIFSVILISIILLAGVIGGFINHLSTALFSSSHDESISSSPINYSKHLGLQILLGVAGAGLIPLLLHLTSSKLFDGNLRPLNFFIFGGYCIIGAIFSQSLLNSLAKRLDLEKVQKEIQRTRDDLKSTNEKLKDAEARAIKAEEEAAMANGYIGAQFKEDEKQEEKDNKEGTLYQSETSTNNLKDKIDVDVVTPDLELEKYLNENADFEIREVLNYLQNSSVQNHSIAGISKKTGVSKENVELIIRAFMKAEMVYPVKWYNNTHYRLTYEGIHTVLTD